MLLTLTDGRRVACEHELEAAETVAPDAAEGEPSAQLERRAVRSGKAAVQRELRHAGIIDVASRNGQEVAHLGSRGAVRPERARLKPALQARRHRPPAR